MRTAFPRLGVVLAISQIVLAVVCFYGVWEDYAVGGSVFAAGPRLPSVLFGKLAGGSLSLLAAAVAFGTDSRPRLLLRYAAVVLNGALVPFGLLAWWFLRGNAPDPADEAVLGLLLSVPAAGQVMYLTDAPADEPPPLATRLS